MVCEEEGNELRTYDYVFGFLLIEISSRKAVPEVLNLLPALYIIAYILTTCNLVFE